MYKHSKPFIWVKRGVNVFIFAKVKYKKKDILKSSANTKGGRGLLDLQWSKVDNFMLANVRMGEPSWSEQNVDLPFQSEEIWFVALSTRLPDPLHSSDQSWNIDTEWQY